MKFQLDDQGQLQHVLDQIYAQGYDHKILKCLDRLGNVTSDNVHQCISTNPAHYLLTGDIDKYNHIHNAALLHQIHNLANAVQHAHFLGHALVNLIFN